MNPARIVSFVPRAACGIAAGCARVPSPPSTATLRDQVFATERAFARTMADRDFAAFTSFLSEEAVFFTRTTPLRGKAQVAAILEALLRGEGSAVPLGARRSRSARLRHARAELWVRYSIPPASRSRRSPRSGARKHLASGGSCSTRATRPATARGPDVAPERAVSDTFVAVLAAIEEAADRSPPSN